MPNAFGLKGKAAEDRAIARKRYAHNLIGGSRGAFRNVRKPTAAFSNLPLKMGPRLVVQVHFERKCLVLCHRGSAAAAGGITAKTKRKCFVQKRDPGCRVWRTRDARSYGNTCKMFRAAGVGRSRGLMSQSNT